jgi:hypothetical protein
MFKFCINVSVTSHHVVTGNVGKVRQVRVTILKGNCYRAFNDFLIYADKWGCGWFTRFDLLGLSRNGIFSECGWQKI